MVFKEKRKKKKVIKQEISIFRQFFNWIFNIKKVKVKVKFIPDKSLEKLLTNLTLKIPSTG